MKILIGMLAALPFHAAWASDFQAERDHCKAGEFIPAKPLLGGNWGLIDSTAWGETGECVKIPIEQLLRAARDLNVMTFKGVTRIDGTKVKPVRNPNELSDLVITYNARHSHIFCMSARWPVEWTTTIVEGTGTSPNRALIKAKRIPGGDSNGAYLKKIEILIEYRRVTSGQASVHMRYEVEAPSQTPGDALGAITGYLDRLTAVASGKKAPGATVDAACPYE